MGHLAGNAIPCRTPETELGELTPVTTKAEARRRFLTWKWDLSFLVIPSTRELLAQFGDLAQRDIMSFMSNRITEEIDAQIRALV